MATTRSEISLHARVHPDGPLGFGGAPIGNLFERIPDAAADDTIATAGCRTALLRHSPTLRRRPVRAPAGPRAALQFCQAPWLVAAVIAGARSSGEMAQNAALMNSPILRALWASLKEAGLLPAHAPEPT